MSSDDYTPEEWKQHSDFSSDLAFALAHGGSDEDVDRMLADHGHTSFAQQSTPLRSAPMTNPTTINGDTVSPLENLGFADACQRFNAEVRTKLDTIANTLAGAGVGEGFVQIVRDVHAAADTYDHGVQQSKDVYARHAYQQAEVAGDPDLANTLAGTYLASANA